MFASSALMLASSHPYVHKSSSEVWRTSSLREKAYYDILEGAHRGSYFRTKVGVVPSILLRLYRVSPGAPK